MRTKFAIIVLPLVILFALVFIPRQHRLETVRAANETMQRRLLAAAPATNGTTQLTQTGLAADDERELLQLRSKISFLRAEYRAASNEVVVLQHSAPHYAKH